MSLMTLTTDKIMVETDGMKERNVKKTFFFVSNRPSKLAFMGLKVDFRPDFEVSFDIFGMP